MIAKKFLAIVFAVACLASISASAAKGPKITKISGWVSNDRCGAKDLENAECTKKCLENGGKLVIVSDKDKSVVNVDNQDALKGHEGQYVRVTGTLDSGTFHVNNVDTLKEPKAKADKSEHHHGL